MKGQIHWIRKKAPFKHGFDLLKIKILKYRLVVKEMTIVRQV